MVKFSKELEAQLIPEWKDAFVNYWQLKKQIKKIKLCRSSIPSLHSDPDFLRSVFDPIAFLVKNISTNFLSFPSNIAERIQVKSKSVEDGADGEVYETELSQLFSEEDEVRMFFGTLDEELNKVNQFYELREREFVERGEILAKQLQILLEVKRILDDRRWKNLPEKSRSGSVSRSWSFSPRNSDFSDRSEISETKIEVAEKEEAVTAVERNSLNVRNSAVRTKTKKGNLKVALRVDASPTTPTRSISAVTDMLWEDLITNPKREGHADFLNRKQFQCAHKMIRGAFVELYRGLGLLKTYSSLNMMAFVKILKKFDKVSNQQASASYLKVVKRSHFTSSDKVVQLMDEVESMFTKHFTSNDRKKAMKYLRPHQKKDSHMVTFFVGLFTGCFVSLFCVYATLAHMSGVFSPTTEGGDYMETVYPVFSMFALLSLHLFMYGCNLFMWKNSRINYNFIFEFQSRKALKYRDAFLICTTAMTTVVGAMVIHLVLGSRGFAPSHVNAIPGILLLIFIAILICPFDVFYRPTRFCFIRVLRNIVCSPFYKVLMVDFFMADQLTSQIPLLRHMESTACYFFAGTFGSHNYNICRSGKFYQDLVYIISFLPYYWRAMQCARRWFDDGDPNHLANMGKYVSAMIAAGARITYSRQKNSRVWWGAVLITSSGATIYQLYWDFVKDWGLLSSKSKNLWLRDELVLKNKGVYYSSMAINVVLRVAWVETVLRLNIGGIQSRLLDFLLASLEVIRRGHWNFYRVENEHLNNVGKYRAVKTVPLPFKETESDG